MLSVQIWRADNGDHLGSWYSDEHAQAPRKGDTLWLETDTYKHSRWKVVEVQWSFRATTHGVGHTRMMTVEIHVKRWDTTPLWQRFLSIFPRAA